MKYIVAVSGGVDSMVLLDMMVQAQQGELIVAHFDHGIRPDSHVDATLVRAAAKKYQLPFETKREELGAKASEARARERRYAFLRHLSQKHGARIVTAHHLDDLIETVAINMTRGTGWRGLAVLDSDIVRPLIDMEKSAIMNYAKKRHIVWREDSTNTDTTYLRNRLRQKTPPLETSMKREIRALHAHQKQLKHEIQQEVQRLVGDGPWYSRYFLSHAQTAVAMECLRYVTQGRLTRPQLARLLHAVKVAKPNTTFEAGEGIRAYFSTRQFSL